jgi:hypothetical protein
MLVAAVFVATPIRLYHGSNREKQNQGRRPKPPRFQETNVAQNHYSSKTKRRPKNNKRKDSSAQTMAALRKREAAEKK